MFKFFARLFKRHYLLNYHFIDKQATKTVVLLHGLGLSLKMWDEVVANLGEVNVLMIDLIGHGASPQPEQAIYDLAEQAQSVIKTIKQVEAIKSNEVILVGYSLGSLVAIELATRKPKMFQQILLCSPPVYQPQRQSKLATDYNLIKIYKEVIANSDKTGELLKILANNKIIYDFEPNKANVSAFMKTLQGSIINQDVFYKLCALDIPTTIVYGVFDVLMDAKNLKEANKLNSDIKLKTVPFSHSMIKPYAQQVAKLINQIT